MFGFKDKKFLDFFFTRIRLNTLNSEYFAQKFCFVSPCGPELNYIEAEDADEEVSVVVANNTASILAKEVERLFYVKMPPQFSKNANGRFKSNGPSRFGRNRKGDSSTQLPSELVDQLEGKSNNTGDAELSKRYEYRGFSKKVLSRKEERKQRRIEKKQRNKTHHSQHAVVPPSSSTLKRKSTDAEYNQSDKKKLRLEGKEKQGGEVKKSKLGKSAATSQDGKQGEKMSAKSGAKEEPKDDAYARRLAKLQQNNPNFYKMLQEKNIVPGGSGSSSGLSGPTYVPNPSSSDISTSLLSAEAFENDEKMIEMYAKKLGIKKSKSSKLPQSLVNDGLDFLFEGLSSVQGESSSSSTKLKVSTSAKKDQPTQSDDDQDEDMSEDDKRLSDEEDEEDSADIEEGDMEFNEHLDMLESALGGLDGSDEDEDMDLAQFYNDEDDEDGDENEGEDDDDEESIDAVEDMDGEDDQEEDSELDAQSLLDDEELSMDDDEQDGNEAIDESEEDSSAEDEEPAKADESPSKPQASTGSKYIPPHLRKKMENESSDSNAVGSAASKLQPKAKTEAYMRLRRTIQGLLNRLSDGNIESIFAGIEEAYQQNSRHDVTEILTDVLLFQYWGSNVSDRSASAVPTLASLVPSSFGILLDSFVLTHACLIAAIFRYGTNFGKEFSAHIVQTVVELMDEARNRLLVAVAERKKKRGSGESEALDDEEDEKEGLDAKRCANLTTLLGYLYNFQVIAPVLIYDLVRQSVSSLGEIDVETLLRLLRISGFQLRSDDPSSLKDIVVLVQNEVARRQKDGFQLSTRAKFMLETIMDLKNNKKRGLLAAASGLGLGGNNNKKQPQQSAAITASGTADQMQQERLKKFLAGLGRRRATLVSEPFRVSLDDIRSVQERGKWWLVGSAWAGRTTEDGDADSNDVGNRGTAKATNSKQDAEVLGNESLLKLARQQGMNTDVRRSIFVVLMSSEDCLDAFERLNKLGLKDKQEREIVRVLIHCCGQEKTYNPYYAIVGQKFCEYQHGFKITFQYAFWDALKELDGGESAKGLSSAFGSTEGPGTVRRVSNLAKMLTHLVMAGSLSLSVIRIVNFAVTPPMQQLFCQLLFISIFTLPASSSIKSSADPDSHIRSIFTRMLATMGSGGAKGKKSKKKKDKFYDEKNDELAWRNIVDDDDADMDDFDRGFDDSDDDNLVGRRDAATDLAEGIAFFLSQHVSPLCKVGGLETANRKEQAMTGKRKRAEDDLGNGDETPDTKRMCGLQHEALSATHPSPGPPTSQASTTPLAMPSAPLFPMTPAATPLSVEGMTPSAPPPLQPPLGIPSFLQHPTPGGIPLIAGAAEAAGGLGQMFAPTPFPLTQQKAGHPIRPPGAGRDRGRGRARRSGRGRKEIGVGIGAEQPSSPLGGVSPGLGERPPVQENMNTYLTHRLQGHSAALTHEPSIASHFMISTDEAMADEARDKGNRTEARTYLRLAKILSFHDQTITTVDQARHLSGVGDRMASIIADLLREREEHEAQQQQTQQQQTQQPQPQVLGPPEGRVETAEPMQAEQVQVEGQQQQQPVAMEPQEQQPMSVQQPEHGLSPQEQVPSGPAEQQATETTQMSAEELEPEMGGPETIETNVISEQPTQRAPVTDPSGNESHIQTQPITSAPPPQPPPPPDPVDFLSEHEMSTFDPDLPMLDHFRSNGPIVLPSFADEDFDPAALLMAASGAVEQLGRESGEGEEATGGTGKEGMEEDSQAQVHPTVGMMYPATDFRDFL
ncbi:suppressor of glycerol defect [Quaeritorhiza haematococci]|nr:suppressor of glycerol defect [Quaeritorhiza haematococci]